MERATSHGRKSRPVLAAHHRVRGHGDGEPDGLEAECEQLRVEDNTGFD